ncbi:hypothetical protein TWF970_000773 [Orbilia oligospora]|uniref:Uncharacterized protein n=1 Tax=Orbilia oligospora TaxID=2813651 RepID=A0A7C8RQY6_ORBOL|nr:hypothetical protein TWF970_000773 [Orbilia oligospora]
MDKPSSSSSSSLPTSSLALQQRDIRAYMMQSRKRKASSAGEVDAVGAINANSDDGDTHEDEGNSNTPPTVSIDQSYSLLPPPKSKPSSKSHFVISIYTRHVESILAGTKTYEFRKYPLPARDMWIYETAPVSAIRYYAVIAAPCRPGEIPEDQLHIERNRQFNDGLSGTLVPEKAKKKPRKEVNWYAHRILEVWKLKEAMSLKALVEKGWIGGAPQKYAWLDIAKISDVKAESSRVEIST